MSYKLHTPTGTETRSAAELVKILTVAQRGALQSGGFKGGNSLLGRRPTINVLAKLGLAEWRSTVYGTYAFLTVEGQKAWHLSRLAEGTTFYMNEAHTEAEKEDANLKANGKAALAFFSRAHTEGRTYQENLDRAHGEALAEDYQRAVDSSVGVVTLPGRICYAAYANGSSVEWMVRYEDKPEVARMGWVLYRNHKVYDRFTHSHAAHTVWAAKIGPQGIDRETGRNN